MKTDRRTLWVLLLAVVLSACSGAAVEATNTPEPSPTSEPTPVPPTALPTLEPTPTLPALSFEPVVYSDLTAGFEFDYPASWTLDEPQSGGARGYYIQLTSWPHAPGDISEETPPGGSRMDVTVQLWEPVNDLSAFVEQRKMAWDASGFSILQEEELTLSGGRTAAEFIIQAPGEQAYFLMAPAGNQYLVFSGTGDLDLLREIARTLRILSGAY